MLIFFWNQPSTEEAVVHVSQWPLSRHHPIYQPGIRFMRALLSRSPILLGA